MVAGGEQFAVHYPSLESAASSADATAQSLTVRIEGACHGCSAAASAHPGWASSAVLRKSAQAWTQQMQAHVSAIAAIASRLRETHNNYAGAEETVCRSVVHGDATISAGV
jgi:uncharacterized protein YukE